LYLRTVLSEGFDFDPRAPGRVALPRSLAAAVGDHLRVLPPETRDIVQMLSVLNSRVPLAQLGQVAEVDSPGEAIEPGVVLRFCLDMAEDDIARTMRISRGTVRSATSRAIATLGRMLREGGFPA